MKTSLHVQAAVVEQIPRVAAFALRHCDVEVQGATVGVLSRIIGSFDDIVVFARLSALLAPFWPAGGVSGEPLRIFLVAATRFGGVGASVEELWRSLVLGGDHKPVSAFLASLAPAEHGILACALKRMKVHAAICAHAVGHCKGVDPGPGGAYFRVTVLSLAVRP